MTLIESIQLMWEHEPWIIGLWIVGGVVSGIAQAI